MFPFLISRLQYNLSQPKILAGFIKGKYLLVSMIHYLVLLTSFPFFQVDIYYQNKIIPDPFSLIDVAFTFNWDRVSSIHFVLIVYLSDKQMCLLKKLIILVKMYLKCQGRTMHPVFLNVKF